MSVRQEGRKLTLSQRRFYSEAGVSSGERWPVPMVLRFEEGGGVREQRFLLRDAETTVTLEGSGEVKWLFANAGSTGFYRVAYEGPMLEKLAANLGALAPSERISLLADRWALMRAGQALGLPLQPTQPPPAQPADGQHGQAHADHDAKGEEDRRHGRVPALEFIQALQFAIGFVGQDQRRGTRHLDGEPVAARGFVGPAEQHQRRAALGVPEPFHGRDLLRLVLQGVQSMGIPHGDLQGDQQRGHGRIDTT